MTTAEKRFWVGVVGLASLALAAGVCALLPGRSAVADEGATEPLANQETSVVLKTLTFKSDYTPGTPVVELWDKAGAWSDPSGPPPGGPDRVYTEPEWTPAHSYPIVHKRGLKLIVKLVLDVLIDKPGPLNYHLVGQGDAGYWAFFRDGSWPGPGANLVIDNVIAAENLPDTVGILKDKQIQWTIRINGEDYALGPTGPHTVYRTYGAPIDGHETVARLAGTATSNNAGCCSWAEGKSTQETVADALWDNLAQPNDPPYEPGEKPLLASDTGRCWELMDGDLSGECDEQARLMEFSCRELGLLAETRKVFASTDAGAGHCLILETGIMGGYSVGLIFAANPAPGDWQYFEGCCEVPGADHYYALWPKLKADNDYDMAKNRLIGGLSWTQWWVRKNAMGQVIPMDGPITLP